MRKATHQLELFTATSGQDLVSFRDDIDLMSLPFLSPSKTPSHEPQEYRGERGGKQLYIKVTAADYGIATQWDGDILMYLRTLLIKAMNEGQPITNRVRFIVNDYLRATGKANGGSEYDQFLGALKRLQNTTIFTNVTTSDEVVDQGFGWINSFKFHKRKATDGANIMAACEVVISDWLFSLITSTGRAISVDPIYFEISGGIERKLYLIARRHVGNQSIWTINLTNLYERVGVKMPLRQFKAKLAKIIEERSLPHYDVELVAELHMVGGKARKRRDMKVVFRPRR